MVADGSGFISRPPVATYAERRLELGLPRSQHHSDYSKMGSAQHFQPVLFSTLEKQ
jgi:hypothetical protein